MRGLASGLLSGLGVLISGNHLSLRVNNKKLAVHVVISIPGGTLVRAKKIKSRMSGTDSILTSALGSNQSGTRVCVRIPRNLTTM